MSQKRKSTSGTIEIQTLLDFLCREYVPNSREKLEIQGLSRFGQLLPFVAKEAKELVAVKELILQYLHQHTPAHPLCLALFGPPGSGKSFAVKQIRAEVEKELGDDAPELPITTINLTQVADLSALGQVLARIAGEQDEGTIPIVFFDEFDAAREGAQFGWLSWLLAPMHDAEFLHEGALVRLRRAIYVFAGGTSSTMANFADSIHDPSFRFAKGPDFISRLRGFLNVRGPNADPRAARRAVVLRSEIENQVTTNNWGTLRVDRDVVESLLMVGRYRYGARSIAAVVELCRFNSANQHLTWAALPEDHLLELHIDRGPLDSTEIGGAVAMSGYTTGSEGAGASEQQEETSPFEKCWSSVANELWCEGATLSYAGGWYTDEMRPLLRVLVTQLSKRTVEPSRSEERRASPKPWLLSFLRSDGQSPTAVEIDRVMSPERRAQLGIHVIAENRLTSFDADLSDWQRQVVERFRRRLSLTEASVARFAVGGALDNHGGRMPGIAEELLLTIAKGDPVYVAGGFGGAASEIGALLGLSRLRTGEIPRSMASEYIVDGNQLDVLADKLRPAPWNDLPVTALDAAKFFRNHAIGGRAWPYNGLSIDENRLLFESTDEEEIAKLVSRGLIKVFG